MVIDVFDTDGITYIGSPVYYLHRSEIDSAYQRASELIAYGHFSKSTSLIGIVDIYTENDQYGMRYTKPIILNGVLVIYSSTEFGSLREYSDLIKLSEVNTVINKLTPIPTIGLPRFYM